MISEDYTFPAVAERYLLANAVSTVHARSIRRHAQAFHRASGGLHANRCPTDSISEFVRSMEEAGLAVSTIRNYRTSILTLIRFAGGFVEGKVRCPKLVYQPVDAWDADELRKILEFVSDLRGQLPNGVDRPTFWRAAIHAGYSTGMRFGDLMRFEVGWIKEDRVADLTQHKTGKFACVRFSQKAMAAIRSHGREKVLPWPETQETFRMEFRWIVRLAGARPGTYKWLRRAAGSYADRSGRGPELLGNTRQVFDKYYRVRKISSPMPPEPPEL